MITAIRNFFSSKKFFIIFFGTLSLLTLSIAFRSLKWTYGLDQQPALFAAYLSDKFGLLPYRDFFYYNLPAVQLLYLVIIKIFGYSYLGTRIADLIYLIVTLTVSFLLFKKISLKAAICGTIVFTIIYFLGQSYFSLQRDYLLILPIISAILLSMSFRSKLMNTKSFLIGFFCSIPTLIKPHAIIVFPVIFLFHLLINSEEESRIFTLRRILKPSILLLSVCLYRF